MKLKRGIFLKLAKKYLIFEIIKNTIFILIISIFFINNIFNHIVKEANTDVYKVSNYFHYTLIENNDEISNKFYTKMKTFLENNNFTFEDIINKQEFIFSDIDIIRIYKNKSNFIEYKDDNIAYTFQNELNNKIFENILNSKKKFYIGDEKLGIFYFNSFTLDNGNIIIIGFNISKDKYIKKLGEIFSLDMTIFYDNTRINTTLTRNQKYQVGTKLDPIIYNHIYNYKLVYDDVIDVLGRTYVTKYTPIYNDGVTRIAIFAGKPVSDIYKDVLQIMLILLLFILIISIIITFLSYSRIKNKYIKSIIKVDNDIKEFMRFKEEYENSNTDLSMINEIFSLENSFSKMKDSIKIYENKLEFQVYFDPLTKLKNVNSLYNDYTCSSYKKTNCHCKDFCKGMEYFDLQSVIMININSITSISNILGNHIGNQTLIKISNILKTYLSNYYIDLYKYSGNKFIFLLPKKVNITAKDILSLLEQPIIIEENIFTMNISIGVYSIDESKENIFESIKKASIALNNARKENGSFIKYYDKSIEKILRDKFILENDIKIGIDHNEFLLSYQPKVNCKTNKAVGFEALIRWNHGVKGMISPHNFIPIAERSGLIVVLGKWVLEESLSFINRLNRKDLHIAINISIIQIIQEDFIEHIEGLLKKYTISGNSVHLEITESVFIDSYETIVEKLNYLRTLGIKIDLDDFGTGYSSLNYLVNLPIDSLKIDKIFVDKIFNENSFLEEIVNIGKKIGLSIIAEGVETIEQSKKISEFNCDIIQGYYYSKPLYEKELIEYINNN